MTRVVVEFDDEVHRDLEELARRLKTTVPDLILSAIDDDFEDDLDAIRAERINGLAHRSEIHLLAPQPIRQTLPD